MDAQLWQSLRNFGYEILRCVQLRNYGQLNREIRNVVGYGRVFEAFQNIDKCVVEFPEEVGQPDRF